MQEIVNRLYTFQLMATDPDFRLMVDEWAPLAEKWDEPEIDTFYKKKMRGKDDA